MLALNSTTHQVRVHLTVTEAGAESCGVVADDVAPGYYPPTDDSSDAPYVIVWLRSDRDITPGQIRASYEAAFLTPCPI